MAITIKTQKLSATVYLADLLSMSLPLTNKAKLVNLYKKEKDPKVKERLLLIIRVGCDSDKFLFV